MYPAVLIVDDETRIIESLEGVLSDDGFEVIHAYNGYEALKKVESESPDIVLLDIWMPGLDGLETLKEIKKSNPTLPVVIITGHGSIEAAVNATKSGAFDFLEKPLSIDRVMVTINNALNFRRLEEENKYLRKKSIEKNSITGSSTAVHKLYREISEAAPSDASILIHGENGTGKELVARTIHQLSKRPEGPFIIVNCAVIDEENIDSELFGHEKGAMGGATARNKGKFELAAGGTLLLDEVGDMSLKTQARILRAMESKTFQRIGGGRPIQMDTRIIASTNKNLKEEIEKGTFREDLYYRLCVIPLHVPPLRDRKKDIPQLVDIFLNAPSNTKGRGDKKNISAEALELLMAHDWPGNQRELKNLMERLTIMSETDTIEPEDIPEPYNTASRESSPGEKEHLFSMDSLDKAKAEFEKEFLKKKVALEDGDIKTVARKTGVDARTISKIVKKSRKK
ncbi:MAG: sigma-54 dependent transcriptional regulator [Desulfarculaceae bacterium]|nr:sigma-54 dependent transcriptional regulator [Desulfarculaceae bacterium]